MLREAVVVHANKEAHRLIINAMLVGSISTQDNELFSAYSLLWYQDKAWSRAPTINTQCLKNWAVRGERQVHTQDAA